MFSILRKNVSLYFSTALVFHSYFLQTILMYPNFKDQKIFNETRKQRVNINDFNIKALIGKGFFGEVHLAIENITRDVYAIKKIPKTTYAKEERNIMAISRSDWIPTLQYAFQVSNWNRNILN